MRNDTTTSKPAPSKHEYTDSYVAAGGASGTRRDHGRTLSPVRTDIGAATVTARDESFIRDLRATYGDKPFCRFDLDAGCIRRAISHGFLDHLDGELASRAAKFKLTARGLSYGNKS